MDVSVSPNPNRMLLLEWSLVVEEGGAIILVSFTEPRWLCGWSSASWNFKCKFWNILAQFWASWCAYKDNFGNWWCIWRYVETSTLQVVSDLLPLIGHFPRPYGSDWSLCQSVVLLTFLYGTLKIKLFYLRPKINETWEFKHSLTYTYLPDGFE